MRRLALLTALLCAAPALAQTPPRPSDSRAPAVTAIAPARPTRTPGDDLTLTPSSLRRQSIVATPRLSRTLEDARAQCRLTCAPTYYECLTDTDRRRCAPSRNACLTDCSKGSGEG